MRRRTTGTAVVLGLLAGLVGGLPGAGPAAAAVGLDPGAGPASGGQRVTISGLSFDVTREVSVGDAHSLVLGADGSVSAWGAGAAGQLGDGTATGRAVPAAVLLPTGAVSVSAGEVHSLAAGSDGAVYAWGSNEFAQLGDGEQGPGTEQPAPVRVDLPGGVRALAVSAGSRHSLAVGSDGAVYAWGANSDGQLGDGTVVGHLVPIRVELAPGVQALSVSAGSRHSLAVGSDGAVYAWGANPDGRLGDGTVTGRLVPTRVELAPGVQALSVSAGSAHSAAVGSDGAVYTWGTNGTGQLGLGLDDTTLPYAATPQRLVLPGGSPAAVASAGTSHSVAVAADGAVHAWGENADGQLGTGGGLPSSAPVRVLLPGVAVAAAAGTGHTLVLAQDGTPYGWGLNDDGQVGDGTTTSRPAPVPVQGVAARATPEVLFGDAAHPGTDVVADAAAGTLVVTTPAHPAGDVGVHLRFDPAAPLPDPVAQYTFLPVPDLGAGGSTITVDPATLPADGASTARVTVRLVDLDGTPFPGTVEEVRIDVVDGPASVGGTVLDADGTFGATVTAATAAGTVTLGFTVDGERSAATARVVLEPGPVDPARSTIAAAPAAVTADGVAGSDVTVTLRDAHDNPVPGAALRITTDLGAITPTADRGDGTYTARLVSSRAGTATVGLALDGVVAGPTARVAFAAPPVHVTVLHATVEAGATQTVTGTGFLPGEQVRVTLASTPVVLAVAVADADGVVTLTFGVPGLDAGRHTVTLTGLGSARAGVAAFVVTAPRVAAPDDGDRSLARTGADGSLALVALALALTAVGVAGLRVRRARRG